MEHLQFVIGHPAYPQDGPNRCEVVSNAHLAAMRLIDRGVSREEARRCINDASAGWLATSETANGGIVEVKAQSSKNGD